MTFAAITTVPKTTHNIFTLNTGETSSNYSVKLSLSPRKSSHGTFLDSLTVDLFKIPDVNQQLKRRHTAPAFHTIFFGLVRNQQISTLEPTLWGQRLVTAKNKAHNIQSFRLKPGICWFRKKLEVRWKQGLTALRPSRCLAVKTNGCREKFQDGVSKYWSV